MAATDEMIDPQPDLDAAVEFLKKWTPGGPWVLTAINPRDKGIQTLAVVDPDRLRNTLAYWSDKRWGIYFQVNPDRRDPGAIRSKAAKADIAEARWLHCDLDIYKGGLSWRRRWPNCGMLRPVRPPLSLRAGMACRRSGVSSSRSLSKTTPP